MFLMAILPVSPYLLFSDGMQRMWGQGGGTELVVLGGGSGIVDLLEEEERIPKQMGDIFHHVIRYVQTNNDIKDPI